MRKGNQFIAYKVFYATQQTAWTFLYDFLFEQRKLFWYAFHDQTCRYRGCEPLVLACPGCSASLECPPIFNSICSSISQKPTDSQAERPAIEFWHKLTCPKCPEEAAVGKLSPALLANQVKIFYCTPSPVKKLRNRHTLDYTTPLLRNVGMSFFIYLTLAGEEASWEVCFNILQRTNVGMHFLP